MAGVRSQQIKDVMTAQVVTLSPTANVTEAAEAMKSLNVGAIPICDGRRLLRYGDRPRSGHSRDGGTSQS
jgi:CBS domain-containing protein